MGDLIPSLFICLRIPGQDGWPPSDESMLNFFELSSDIHIHTAALLGAIYQKLFEEVRAIIDLQRRDYGNSPVPIRVLARNWRLKMQYDPSANEQYRDRFFADALELAHGHVNRLVSLSTWLHGMHGIHCAPTLLTSAATAQRIGRQ